MKLSTVVIGLLLSSYMAAGTPPSLFSWLPSLLPFSLTSLLPFPLALPLALVGPLPWVLPLAVGLKGATLLGLGFATGGAAGAGLAGLGAIGLKAALANSAALKIAGLGAVAAKAKVTSAAATAAAEAGVKAIVAGAKSKLAVAPVVAAAPVIAAAPVVPAPPVVAAPTIPVSSVVPASITNVKIFKPTPPRITARPVPVDPWKFIMPTGWDTSLSYGHPLYGYGFTRSAIELRKRREAPAPNSDLAPTGAMNPLALKQIFAYVSTYDSEKCVLRVICEVAAQPSLAGPQGKSVAEFMTSLSKEDSSAPWMPYRDAAVTGQVMADRNQCHQRYPSCTKSTESLVEMARARISQASEAAAANSGAISA